MLNWANVKVDYDQEMNGLEMGATSQVKVVDYDQEMNGC